MALFLDAALPPSRGFGSSQVIAVIVLLLLAAIGAHFIVKAIKKNR